jgi:putative salt-induced outer membrane protein YdiY
MFGILVTTVALALGQVTRANVSASDVEQQAPSTAPAPEAPAKPEASGWKGTVGIGFISITGNATTLTFNANAAVERKLEQWIFAAKANGVYGRSKIPGTSEAQVVALAAGTQLRVDRLLSSWITVFVQGGIETDHVKSLEAREFGEGGVGLIWIDQKEGDLQKMLLRTDISFRYQYETRFQYYPAPTQNLGSVTLVAPRFGVAFRYALSPQVRFLEAAEILPNITGDSRVLINSTSKLSVMLTQVFSLGVSYVVNYDSMPAVGKVSTDTALGLTLDALF